MCVTTGFLLLVFSAGDVDLSASSALRFYIVRVSYAFIIIFMAAAVKTQHDMRITTSEYFGMRGGLKLQFRMHRLKNHINNSPYFTDNHRINQFSSLHFFYEPKRIPRRFFPTLKCHLLSRKVSTISGNSLF